MKTEILKGEYIGTMPEVGQAFTFTDYGRVYIRIPDEDGARATNLNYTHNRIFGVALEGVTIEWFSTPNTFILLEPADGTLKFKPTYLTQPRLNET